MSQCTAGKGTCSSASRSERCTCSSLISSIAVNSVLLWNSMRDSVGSIGRASA